MRVQHVQPDDDSDSDDFVSRTTTNDDDGDSDDFVRGQHCHMVELEIVEVTRATEDRQPPEAAALAVRQGRRGGGWCCSGPPTGQ